MFVTILLNQRIFARTKINFQGIFGYTMAHFRLWNITANKKAVNFTAKTTALKLSINLRVIYAANKKRCNVQYANTILTKEIAVPKQWVTEKKTVCSYCFFGVIFSLICNKLRVMQSFQTNVYTEIVFETFARTKVLQVMRTDFYSLTLR